MKKIKAKQPQYNIPVPQPPVSAMFTADGLMLTVIEGKNLYHKTVSWKELYKIGKKGKKMTPPDYVKTMTAKLDDMLSQRAKDDAERQKALDELKKKYQTPVRVPLAPVIPVPQYRPAVQAVPGPAMEEPLTDVVPPPPPTEN